jgi:hypothetical protein
VASSDGVLICIPYNSGFSANFNGTRYTQYYAPSSTLYTNEAEARCVAPKSIMHTIWARVNVSTMVSATFTVMKNGVATSLAVSFGSSETGLKSATSSVPFEFGDEYSIRLEWNYGSGAPKDFAFICGGVLYGNY